MNPTMESKKKVFNRLLRESNDIYLVRYGDDIMESIKSLFKGEEEKRYNLYEIQERIDSFFAKNDSSYKEIVEYIKQFWGKYVRMRFVYNGNYTETRETEPVWVAGEEYTALLYCFIPVNDCLFGLYCDMNNTLNGGVKDTSIDLREYMYKYNLEIEEITKEEFINSTEYTLSRCINNRMDKINSDKYSLTENGYKRKME